MRGAVLVALVGLAACKRTSDVPPPAASVAVVASASPSPAPLARDAGAKTQHGPSFLRVATLPAGPVVVKGYPHNVANGMNEYADHFGFSVDSALLVYEWEMGGVGGTDVEILARDGSKRSMMNPRKGDDAPDPVFDKKEVRKRRARRKVMNHRRRLARATMGRRLEHACGDLRPRHGHQFLRLDHEAPHRREREAIQIDEQRGGAAAILFEDARGQRIDERQSLRERRMRVEAITLLVANLSAQLLREPTLFDPRAESEKSLEVVRGHGAVFDDGGDLLRPMRPDERRVHADLLERALRGRRAGVRDGENIRRVLELAVRGSRESQEDARVDRRHPQPDPARRVDAHVPIEVLAVLRCSRQDRAEKADRERGHAGEPRFAAEIMANLVREPRAELLDLERGDQRRADDEHATRADAEKTPTLRDAEVRER